MNKATLTGYVGQDPSIANLENTRIGNFTLATSHKWKNKDGEKQERTEWHRIVVFGPKADLAEQYIKKGSHLLIEGEIRTRNYDDKEGNKRYVTEIYASTIEFLGSGNSSQQPTQQVQQQAEFAAQNHLPQGPDDDLPF